MDERIRRGYWCQDCLCFFPDGTPDTDDDGEESCENCDSDALFGAVMVRADHPAYRQLSPLAPEGG